MKQCGIYIIKNQINDYVYVGQSVNIEARWFAHRWSGESEKAQDRHTPIHVAMKEIGRDLFYLEVLELCDYAELDDREVFWIKHYNSFHNGYNGTPGGTQVRGENNPRAILTEAQVEEIREAYGARIPFREVLDKYKDTISKRGLRKVWHFETWLHVRPEVYTDENRLWHSTNSKANIGGNVDLGHNNKARACSEAEIAEMRRLRETGLSYQKIADRVGRSSTVVRKYCLHQESKSPGGHSQAVQVQNMETGLVFNSMAAASKWAKCASASIRKHKDTPHSAGYVPTTGQPAHWKTL